MRSFRPESGTNTAGLVRFWGRIPMNGAAAPASWTQGGKGMGVPTRTSAGLFKLVLTDAPPGVLVGWNFSCRADAIANVMAIYGLTWNATTYTLTYTTAVPTTPLTAADPPAAATDREFCIELLFSNKDNL